jgi:hypothetical protein
MYEIWLVMNIVYEIALGIWPLLALLLAVWAVMLVAARRRLGARQVRQAALLGALVAVALFFSVPTLTQSSLANMGYWVDWANLLAVALGLGALAAVFSLPLLGLAGGRR